MLLVVDAMTGQDAVNVAEQFAEAAEFDGVVMTKLDGDARGGAALSVKAVTGKPILFASTGEKLERLRALPPRPHGLAHPRHGRRPVAIEKAEQQVDEDEAEELERKLRKNEFTLEDFLDQLKQIRKMGPLEQPARDDARAGGPCSCSKMQRRRARARPRRGDHPLDDARGAAPTRS